MRPLEIGVMINNLERDRLKAFRVAREHGFESGQTSPVPEAWFDGPELQTYINTARRSGLEITAMFVGFDGQSYADIPTIERTVGLVNPAFQEHRKRVVFKYCELARDLGVSKLAAHIGFVPHDPDHPHYSPLVHTLQEITERCASLAQEFLLETGQEPAEVLLRLINDVARPNLGVNFDAANMVLYGTGEPVASLDLLQPFVRGVHCKDGLWPERPGTLGREVPLGKGAVDFPAIIRLLKTHHYSGPLTIEREGGPHVGQDVQEARAYVQALLGEFHKSTK
jgi:sugar phosphate isomerase/epimerase